MKQSMSPRAAVEIRQRLKKKNRALGICLGAMMALLFGAAFFKAKQRWHETPPSSSGLPAPVHVAP